MNRGFPPESLRTQVQLAPQQATTFIPLRQAPSPSLGLGTVVFPVANTQSAPSALQSAPSALQSASVAKENINADIIKETEYGYSVLYICIGLVLLGLSLLIPILYLTQPDSELNSEKDKEDIKNYTIVAWVLVAFLIYIFLIYSYIVLSEKKAGSIGVILLIFTFFVLFFSLIITTVLSFQIRNNKGITYLYIIPAIAKILFMLAIFVGIRSQNQ